MKRGESKEIVDAKTKSGNELACKVSELYEIRAELLGFSIQEENKVKQIYLGFVNEKGVTEGTKRIANKIGKRIADELAEIDKQRQEIKKFGELTEEEREGCPRKKLRQRRKRFKKKEIRRKRIYLKTR